ncbi:MAG: helicase-related protein [Methanocorpusculum sp.]|nr:helicase-related protein [Methanocorpusculum sp.]
MFVESRSFAERLIAPLKNGLSSVYIHHSAVSADDRRTAEESFGKNAGTCVICTSTMELGIDIGELDLVVQYGAPLSVSSFLQRLGRTGRRGKPASMTFVLKNACELMIAVSVIESAARHESEPLCAPAVPYHVLVQQLFLLLRGKTGLGNRQILHALLSLSPFSDISPETAGEVLSFLLQNGYLTKTGDLYQVGPRAEAELGRSNWRSLLSVIHDTGGYTAVLPDGTVIGTLDARFVAGDPGKTFTFTGKTWRLLFRDDAHKRALIEPSSASKGLKRPFWSGDGSAAAATRTVCMSAAQLIARGETALPLLPEQKELLDDLLASLPDDIIPGKIHIRTEPETEGWSVVVSTFFGERANSVLARLIRNRLPPGHTVRHTQFAVRIFEWDSGNAGEQVRRVLEEIADADFSALADELPALPETAWKFGNLLPEHLQKEMAVTDYYHLPELTGLLAWLRLHR